MANKVKIYTDGTTPGLPKAAEGYSLAGKELMVHNPAALPDALPVLVPVEKVREGIPGDEEKAVWTEAAELAQELQEQVSALEATTEQHAEQLAAAVTEEKLLPALLERESNDGTVITTRIGKRIRRDLNIKLNESGGLITYNWLNPQLQAGYVQKAAYDADITILLNQLSGGTFNASLIPNVLDDWDGENGIALADGNLATWTGKNGNVLLMNDADIYRPAYDATGGPNGKPQLLMDAGKQVWGNVNIPANTVDMTVYMIVKIKEPYSVGYLMSLNTPGANGFYLTINEHGPATITNTMHAEGWQMRRSVQFFDYALLRVECYRSNGINAEAIPYVNDVQGDYFSYTGEDNTSPYPTFSQIRIGGNGNFNLSRLLIVNGRSSAAQNFVIQQHLKAKYGITF